MSNRPSPLGWLTKFVVAPAVLAAVGYYVVGPRVGGKMSAPAPLASLRNQWVAQAEKKTPPAVGEPAPTHVTMSAPAPSGSGPQVDVDVHRTVNGPTVDVATEEPPKPRRKRKRRRKPTPPPVESAPEKTPASEPKVLEPAPSPTTPPPADPPADPTHPIDQGGSGGAATAGGAGIE